MERNSGQGPNRFWLPDYFVDCDVLCKLSSNEVKVLLVYARFAGKDGLAWPSVAKVAYMTGLSARSVQRALRALQSPHGLLQKQSAGKGGRANGGVPNTTKYRVFFQSYLDFTSSKGDNAVRVRGSNGVSGDAVNAPNGDSVDGVGCGKPVDNSPQGCQNGSSRVTKQVVKGDSPVTRRNIEGSKEGRTAVEGGEETANGERLTARIGSLFHVVPPLESVEARRNRTVEDLNRMKARTAGGG